MKSLHVLPTHLETMHKARLGLRATVCRQCAARPPGSELLDADKPRSCEKQCELFNDLPLLVRTARCIDPLVGSFDRALEGHLKRLSQKPTCSGNEPECHAHRRQSWAKHTQQIICVLRNLVRK